MGNLKKILFILAFSLAYIECRCEVLIGEIEIRRGVIFTDSTDIPIWVVHMLNKIHFLTSEDVVRRELLFKEGDIYEPELLCESERNLRNLDFFSKVEISADKISDGRVDIVVNVEDRWTTFLGFTTEGGSGWYELGIMAGDYNLFGRGQWLEFSFVTEKERNTGGITLEEPRLFGSRWAFKADYQNYSDGSETALKLEHPLYSLQTKWAYGGYIAKSKKIERLYEEGEPSSEFNQNRKMGWMYLTRSFGEKIKTNLSLSYNFEEMNFTPTDSEPIPSDFKNSILNLSSGVSTPNFIEETFLDSYGDVEDLDIGLAGIFSLGRGLKILGSDDERILFSVSISKAFRFANRVYTKNRISISGYFLENTSRNIIGTDRFTLYIKLPRQTFASRLIITSGSRLDDYQQILLGSHNGLRGYHAYRFAGTRSLLFNLEDRIYLGTFFTIGLGIVPFFDSGSVWSNNENFRVENMHSSVGVGIRFGFGKVYKARIGRIDFVYPLDGGDFSISFGAGHHFNF